MTRLPQALQDQLNNGRDLTTTKPANALPQNNEERNTLIAAQRAARRRQRLATSHPAAPK